MGGSDISVLGMGASKATPRLWFIEEDLLQRCSKDQICIGVPIEYDWWEFFAISSLNMAKNQGVALFGMLENGKNIHYWLNII